jgi:glycosyltransferase involved in cell wall biosynthesis
VGRYVDGLVAAMPGEFVIACQSRDAQHYAALAPNATVLPQGKSIASVPVRLLWEQFVLPRVARRAGVRVIHSPHYTLPLFSRLRRVSTFHDATFFSDPGVHTALKRAFFRAWIRVTATVADAIVVPSEATADELGRYVRRARGYVVAHHGVDPAVFHPPTGAEVDRVRGELGLDSSEWIAFLGTIEPRKNLVHLVRGYREFVEDAGSAPVPALVLAGGSGWNIQLDDEVALVASPGCVVRPGYLELDRLRALLGGAVLVCYPSLGEGFGLPVLEAMASGAAVLTTRRLALPEVGGDAVEYTETDTTAIAAALRRLVPNRARRRELGRRGIERAASFTWGRCAQVHRQVFDSLT